MALNLSHHRFRSPSSITHLQLSLSHLTLSKPSFFLLHPKTPTTSLSLCASSASSPSNAPIFLPYLQQEEEEEEEEADEEVNAIEAREEEQEQPHDPDDPIYKFFKERTLVPYQDPPSEGKLTLQKNRRISWHLAAADADLDEEEEAEVGLDDEIPLLVEEKEEEEEKMGWQKKELPEGIVGEIVQLARNLPENVTLEEALNNGFEGRVSGEDCWEVLEVLGEMQLLVCCLYFFQWMRTQEPSLVTPRACTVLFPVLGRARMGDKLMVLFRNLPSSKEFRDVHVYNAAISGLLASGRYKILGTLMWFACFFIGPRKISICKKGCK